VKAEQSATFLFVTIYRRLSSVDLFGTSLAQSIIILQRKEVKIMNIRTSILAGMFFLSSLGTVNSAIAEDGVISKQEFTPGSYCHEKFRAITPSTLWSDQPELKDSTSADVIDFYGPCDETPLGKDQVQAQRMQNRHPWARDYND
jgi:hypothetical protein